METSHTLDLTSDMTPFLPLPSFEGFSYYRTSVSEENRPKSDEILCQDLVSLSFFVAGRCASKIRDGRDLLVGKLRFSEISRASRAE